MVAGKSLGLWTRDRRPGGDAGSVVGADTTPAQIIHVDPIPPAESQVETGATQLETAAR